MHENCHSGTCNGDRQEMKLLESSFFHTVCGNVPYTVSID